MLTRSKSKRGSVKSTQEDQSVSSRSSVSAQARVLTAEAQHKRRLADLETASLAVERAAAEAEHRAEIAAIKAEVYGSRQSSRTRSRRSHSNSQDVQEWLECQRDLNNASFVSQAHEATSSAPISNPIPYQARSTMDAPPLSSTSPVLEEAMPQQASKVLISPNCTSSLPHVSTTSPLLSAYNNLPTSTNNNYVSCSAPIHTAALRGTTLIGTAPAPRVGASSIGWMPADSTVQAYTHSQMHRVGTHPKVDSCNLNINSAKNNDTLQLAEAIANIAASAAHRTPKVSGTLPVFDGQPMDWLFFKKAYETTSPSYSPEENLSRIGAALRGVAYNSVAILLAAARNPFEVMQALEDEFAKPERIILSELVAIRGLPKISNLESAKEVNSFACRVRHCTGVVRLLNLPEYLASPELSNEIVGKLTTSMRSQWMHFACEREPLKMYRLELLSEFLMQQANLKSKYDFMSESVKRDTRDIKCHVTTESSITDKFKKVCLFCQKIGHIVIDCEEFHAMSIDDRWEWVTTKKVCRKCFIKGNHFYRTCNKFSCKKQNCGNRASHHSLLHKDSPHATIANVNVDVNDDISAQDNSATDIVTHNFTRTSQRPLLKVVPVKVSGPKGTIKTYALLDDGSTATLVDSSIATAVGATGKQTLLRVNGVGGMSKESTVTLVTLELQGLYSSQMHKLENVRSIPNLGLTSQTVKSGDLRSYDYLAELVETLSYDDARPMLLIGIDNWHLLLPHTVRRGCQSQPVAALTSLGWVLFGFTKSNSSAVEFVSHCDATDENTLDQQLKEYFRIDSIGISKKEYYSKDDVRAFDILNKTTRRLSSGRFETGLLWREDIKNVPNSYDLAHSRFISLERKMKKDVAYADAYRKNINVAIQKGYAEQCINQSKSDLTWYLPHFGVFHPQKQKLRVVLDAAAKSSGVSLNTLLLPGPDLLQPLLAILMRFREGAVALNGDIREMFPQTKIRPEDRDAQRFLWRDDPSQTIREFRMSSMIFGATSSPFTAIFLKNRNAEEHRSVFPAAANAIINDHYMDDYLGSVDSIEEATQLVSDIVHVHSKACLEMTSWVSNRVEALSSLPPDLCAFNAASKGVHILGVMWNVNDDRLCFSRTVVNLPSKMTKRSVLAYLMRIYDPLGFLTPIIIKGRAIFQETWKLNVGWDQELPSSFMTKWNAWFLELNNLASGSVPRHYLDQHRAESAELHVFGDASEVAYACVAYWRFSCINGGVVLSLIGGKARLAPLKPVSIPRLELQAALMATRFASYIIEAHRRKPSKLFLWTDSLTVLKWLRSDVRSFKAYVSHRVGEILESTNTTNWHYVPTALNVADDATRISCEFTMSSRWFSGPSFLTNPKSQWPIEPSSDSVLDSTEMKRPVAASDSQTIAFTYAHKLASPVVAEPTRFSEWLRLLRATARVLQCVNVFRTFISKNNCVNQKLRSARPGSVSPSKFPLLSIEELTWAEQQLLLHSQWRFFEEEFIALSRGNPRPRQCRLRNIDVFIDEAGLLRLKGRISAVEEVDIDKNPIILHGKSHLVRLLIHFHHKRTAHSGSSIIINELRQRFYIIGIRMAVKSVVKSCLQCKLKMGSPTCPAVGDLPSERLAHHIRVFTHVGLDYFGPVTITVGRRSEKRYVALFTCLSVRAVHLEIVGSLSTDAAIMALRRFIARRGCPQTIYSDNGTAFVGANRELRKLYEEPIQEFAVNKLIRWKFIPPSSPFMGGCWERLVRSVKTGLSATLKERAPNEETFATFLLEVESILNSRPLTHVDTDPATDRAITPFHFILGSSSTYSPLVQLDDADLVRRVRWRKGLRLADHFWARWLREYLPSLIPRASVSPSPNLKVGDLVLIADGNLPRGVWPRGRITQVLPGSDGIVRIVDVATTHGVLRRPVKKLIPLTVADTRSQLTTLVD